MSFTSRSKIQVDKHRRPSDGQHILSKTGLVTLVALGVLLIFLGVNRAIQRHDPASCDSPDSLLEAGLPDAAGSAYRKLLEDEDQLTCAHEGLTRIARLSCTTAEHHLAAGALASAERAYARALANPASRDCSAQGLLTVASRRCELADELDRAGREKQAEKLRGSETPVTCPDPAASDSGG